MARAFRLLAHAEIESFLEDRAREKAREALVRYRSDGKPRIVIWSLLSFQLVQTQLTEGQLKDHYLGASDHFNNIATKAHNSFEHLLLHNHGVREKNVLSMLLPVGFLRSQIDTTWLSTIDSFGSNRGATAHSAYKPTVLVDPATEKTTVGLIVAGLQRIDDVFARLR